MFPLSPPSTAADLGRYPKTGKWWEGDVFRILQSIVLYQTVSKKKTLAPFLSGPSAPLLRLLLSKHPRKLPRVGSLSKKQLQQELWACARSPVVAGVRVPDPATSSVVSSLLLSGERLLIMQSSRSNLCKTKGICRASKYHI